LIKGTHFTDITTQVYLVLLQVGSYADMKKLLNKDKVATSVSDKQSNGSSGKTIPNTVGNE